MKTKCDKCNGTGKSDQYDRCDPPNQYCCIRCRGTGNITRWHYDKNEKKFYKDGRRVSFGAIINTLNNYEDQLSDL